MTLRAHIYIVNLSLLFAFSSCTAKKTPSAVQQKTESQNLATQDLNNDKRPDRWTWSAPGATPTDERIVLKEEVDFNFDGKVDLQKIYEAGTLKKTSMDFDFDGEFDLEEEYVGGQLEKSTLTQGLLGDKKLTWKFFEQGQLKKIEKDTNRDGQPDIWMYFERQALTRLGHDYNYDGTIDHWEEFNPTSPK